MPTSRATGPRSPPRLGRTDEARDAYRRALALVHDDAERRLLGRRLAELGTATGPHRH
jgi:predicted RNA polymerase sigma factor